MVEPPHDTAAARRAWAALHAAGGLVGNADLRTRWATSEEPLTRQRVQELTAMDGFPSPVVKGGRGSSALWLTAEVDEWRRAYDERPGRRGPRPRQSFLGQPTSGEQSTEPE